MLSLRIQSMIEGYKRKNSNTNQFLMDLENIDKLVARLIENKNYIKTRNKYIECLEVFEYKYVNNYIVQYHSPFFRPDSLELWETISNEIKSIKGIK